MHNTAWFVDMGYVVKASEGKFKLDYVLAQELLNEKCGPTRSFLFNSIDDAYGIPSGLQRFYAVMEEHGMQVRLQPMESGGRGSNRQRRVDVDLSSHMVWQASLPDVETLVLTSGDQDFVPALEMVRETFGKRVLLFTYDAVVHEDLVTAAHEWWHFEAYQEHLARW